MVRVEKLVSTLLTSFFSLVRSLERPESPPGRFSHYQASLHARVTGHNDVRAWTVRITLIVLQPLKSGMVNAFFLER